MMSFSGSWYGRSNGFRVHGILLSLACILSVTSHAQSADDIFSKYADTTSLISGHEWKNVKTVYMEWTSWYDQQSYEGKFRLTTDQSMTSYIRFFKVWPDHQLEELYSDSLFTQRTSRFLFLPDRHVIQVGPSDPLTAKVNKRLWFDFLPSKLIQAKRRGATVFLNSVTNLPDEESQRCYEVVVEDDGEKITYYFDQESYLLLALQNHQGDYYARFMEYRRFGDFLLPSKTISSRQGIIFSSVEYRRVEFNKEISRDIFRH